MTPHVLLRIAGPDSPGHAVPEGTLEALCGTTGEATIPQPFPAGARSLCRVCQRANAVANSTVPLRSTGARKRPGGM